MARRADLVYRRTQFGAFTVLAVGAAVVLLAVLGALTGNHPVTVAVLLLLVAVLGMFCCLTIEIDGRQLRCSFGPGLIRRTIAVHEIVSAVPVRNRWYYGWGIRLTPSGWMFNVSGLDAVEVALASGSRFRIGTDQPDDVIHALARVTTLAARPPGDLQEGESQ
jgi:hypothetical protein